MSKPVDVAIVCPQCRAAIDASDNYCRRCGTPLRAGLGMIARPASWWESPVVVLCLLFLVIGPLATPLLWRSRRFSTLWKIILTVLVTIVTAYLCWQLWFTVRHTYEEINKVLGLVNGSGPRATFL